MRNRMEKNMQADAGTILKRYILIALFCAVFSAVYSVFSHGIRSFWMTFLFLWPLLTGGLPALLQRMGVLPWFEAGEGTGAGLQSDLRHFGTAALTAASLLKGILEIAGTDSVYPDVLLWAGAVMYVAGWLFCLIGLRRGHRK